MDETHTTPDDIEDTPHTNEEPEPTPLFPNTEEDDPEVDVETNTRENGVDASDTNRDLDPKNPAKRDTTPEGVGEKLDTQTDEAANTAGEADDAVDGRGWEETPVDAAQSDDVDVDSGNDGGGAQPAPESEATSTPEPATRAKRSLVERLKHRAAAHGKATLSEKTSAISITPGVETKVKDQTRALVRGSENRSRLLKIKPHIDGQLFEGGNTLLNSLYGQYERSLTKLHNVSPIHSFEIWMEGGEIAFYMYVENEDLEKSLIGNLSSLWPNCTIERVWAAQDVQRHLDSATGDGGPYESDKDVPLSDEHIPLPTIDTTYLAATSATMKMEHSYPLRSTKGVRDTENDPLSSLCGQMNSNSQNHFIIQVTMKPVKPMLYGWSNPPRFRLPWNKTPEQAELERIQKRKKPLQKGMDPDERPTDDEQTIQNVINTRTTENAFKVDVRVIGLGEDKTTIEQGVRSARNVIDEKYDENDTTQGLYTWAENGVRAIKQLKRVNARSLNGRPRLTWMLRSKWWRGRPIAVPARELAMLVHLPNQEQVNNPSIDWQRARTGESVPAAAESFGEWAKKTEPIPPGVKLDQLYGDDPPVTLDESLTIEDTEFGDDHTETDMRDDEETPEPGEETPIETGVDADEHTQRNEATMSQHDPVDNTDTQRRDPFEDTPDTTHEPRSQSRDTTPDDTTLHPHVGYPQWLQQQLSPGEEVEYFRNPSAWISTLPYGIGALLMLIGGVELTALATDAFPSLGIMDMVIFAPQGVIPTPEVVVPLCLILGGLGVILGERYRRRHVYYVITNRRVMKKKGVWRWLHLNEASYTSIRGKQKRVNPAESFRGIGKIEIQTSATGSEENPEMVFTHVKDVGGALSKINKHYDDGRR